MKKEIILNKFLKQIGEDQSFICMHCTSEAEIKRTFELLHLCGAISNMSAIWEKSLLKFNIKGYIESYPSEYGYLISPQTNIYKFNNKKDECLYIEFREFESLMDKRIQREVNRYIK